MPDPVPTAQGKIIDAYAELLEGYTDLAGKTVITDRSRDDPLATEDLDAIVIYAEAWDFDDDDRQGQTIHRMLLNFDVLSDGAVHGAINRANQETIAHIVAAIHSDPVLGGRLEDARALNVAPPVDNGKSVGGASLQVALTFYTPLGDHFTIVGAGGTTF